MFLKQSINENVVSDFVLLVALQGRVSEGDGSGQEGLPFLLDDPAVLVFPLSAFVEVSHWTGHPS